MYKSMYRVQGARSARWEMQQRRERESRPVASGATAAPSKRYREGRKQKTENRNRGNVMQKQNAAKGNWVGNPA